MNFYHHSATLLLLSFLAIACKIDTSENRKTAESEINATSPIVEPFDTLSPAQLKDISAIHSTFNAVYPVSLEETIQKFKDNPDSKREIEVWKKMVETFENLTKGDQYTSLAAQQDVFSVILASTMMPLTDILERLEFVELGKDEVERIHNLFMNSFSEE